MEYNPELLDNITIPIDYNTLEVKEEPQDRHEEQSVQHNERVNVTNEMKKDNDYDEDSDW